MRKFESSKLNKIIFIVVHAVATFYLYVFVSYWLGYDDFEEWALDRANNSEIENSLIYFNTLGDYSNRMVNGLFIGIGILVVYWGGRFIFNYIFPEVENNNEEEK